MPEVINLDELVPDDITFKYRGEDYPIPGDLSTENVFKLYRLFSDLNTRKGTARSKDQVAEIEAAGKRLEAGLLQLFQIRRPDLKTLPFGVSSLAIITPRVLALLGVNLTAEEPESPPTQRAKSPTKKKTASRSKRSTGSAG